MSALSRRSFVARLLAGALLCAVCNAGEAFGQSAEPYTLDQVAVWVRAGVPAKRIQNGYLSRTPIAFEVTDGVERYLRELGAGDEMIEVLKAARVVAVTPGRAQKQHVVSRRDLWPVYYPNRPRVLAYVTQLRMTERSGTVDGIVMNHASITVPLESVALPRAAIMYGFSAGLPGASLDVEMYWHDPNLKMFNMGVALEPFVPLGATRLRLIAGVTPYLGFARQTVGHAPSLANESGYDAIDVMNWTYGGNTRLGLAYHFPGGPWLYAEFQYRYAATSSRELRVPDGTRMQDLSWPAWRAAGTAWRLGMGW